MVQAFLKKWWVESDFKAPNLPLSLRLKGSDCHYYSIYNILYTLKIHVYFKLFVYTYEHCVIYFSVSITITAASKNVLGEDFSAGSGAWCWISACLTKKEQVIWMAVTGRGWEVLTYLVTAVTFILLKFYMLMKVRCHVLLV